MKGHFVFKTPDIATTPTYSIPPPSLPFRSSFPVLSPSFARHPSSLHTLSTSSISFSPSPHLHPPLILIIPIIAYVFNIACVLQKPVNVEIEINVRMIKY